MGYGDGREYETAEPVFQGRRANAYIPPGMHIQNEGGIDGAGLCVIASNVLDGVFQRVPELRDGKNSATWKAAKRAPGGYNDSKLKRLWDRVGMRTPYASVTGSVAEVCAVVEYYTRLGIPTATTMNTGARYGYMWIAHMVTTIHLDDEWACVVDNNYPNVYFWMPRAEYESRLVSGGVGWVVVLLWLQGPLSKAWLAAAVASGLVFVGVAIAAAVLLYIAMFGRWPTRGVHA